MGHKKLIRFEAIKTFSNVFEHPSQMKGKWNSFFKNNNPIVLELACGKGEYAVGLGTLHPNNNYIGVDIKGNRLWRGAKTALDTGLTNVGFVRGPIDQITDFFDSNEVAEIWITFPDPQLRLSKAKKRLTHPKFLRKYSQTLQPGGIVHLKTDSPDLYHFTKIVINLFGLTLLKDTDNLYQQTDLPEELGIKTYYESLDIAKSNRIHYLQFCIDKDLPIEKDELLKQLISEHSIN